MPKVIDGLQSRIMQSARERLFAAPPSFSLRAIAKDCGIAVGTIYNYFPDKDWNQIIAETEASISASEGIEEGVRAIYSGLARFTQSHRTVWNAFPSFPAAGAFFHKGHRMLVGQIERLLNILFEQFGKTPDSAGLVLTAELLIAASQHSELSEEDIMRVLRRQIKGE